MTQQKVIKKRVPHVMSKLNLMLSGETIEKKVHISVRNLSIFSPGHRLTEIVKMSNKSKSIA
jgi:hypothetical protein